MKTFLGLLVGVGLVAAPMATVRAADQYASAVVGTSTANLLGSSNALGAPDGAYADFRAASASLTLDMGSDVTGDLSLTVYLLQSGAQFYVSFYNEAWEVVAAGGDSIPIGATLMTAQNTSGLPYRYVKVASLESEQWRLDAVAATTTEAEVEPIVEEPVDESPSASHAAGTLLKTDESSAVYILGSDGSRHAFPTEREFVSWGLSFDDVETVSASALAAYDLGNNVTIRPGTYLVKLQTNPKVFSVEPGGVLRWVATEAVALQLYGGDWSTRVVDVSDAFWGNYTVGTDIDTAVHPDGTVIRRNGTWYYVADASRAALTEDDIATLRLNEDFALEGINATIVNQYADTVASLLTAGAQWPY